MYGSSFILAYFSPETTLPLTSIVVTIAGGAMLLTRGSLRFLIRCLRIAIRRPREAEAAGTSRPHRSSPCATLSEEAAR
jgi:hypothetical protein